MWIMYVATTTSYFPLNYHSSHETQLFNYGASYKNDVGHMKPTIITG